MPTTDPYGFAAILNQYRAAAGLAPLAYDHDLSAWAAQNNVAQSNRGIGHHVTINCLPELRLEHPRRREHGRRVDELARSPGEHAHALGHPLRHRVRAGALLDDERGVNWK